VAEHLVPAAGRPVLPEANVGSVWFPFQSEGGRGTLLSMIGTSPMSEEGDGTVQALIAVDGRDADRESLWTGSGVILTCAAGCG